MREYYQRLYRHVTSEPPGHTLHLLNPHPEITVKYSRPRSALHLPLAHARRSASTLDACMC